MQCHRRTCIFIVLTQFSSNVIDACAFFTEHYRNQTLKLIAAIEFISVYCSKVPLILKLDDDVLFYPSVMLPRLVKVFLAKTSLPSEDTIHQQLYALPANTIACHLITGYEIWRYADHPKSPYIVDTSVLPGEKYYPPFCAGYFVAMSGDTPEKLKKYIVDNKAFWIDDRYMGILQQQANSTNVNMQHKLSFGYAGITYSYLAAIAQGSKFAIHLAKAKSHLFSLFNYIDGLQNGEILPDFQDFHV